MVVIFRSPGYPRTILRPELTGWAGGVSGGQPAGRAVNDNDRTRVYRTANVLKWYADGEVAKTIAVEITFSDTAAAPALRAVLFDSVGIARRVRQVITRVRALLIAPAWTPTGFRYGWRAGFTIRKRRQDQSSH